MNGESQTIEKRPIEGENKTCMRLLVAGCATRRANFLRAMGALPWVRLTGVIDPKPGPASLKLARNLGAPVFKSASDVGESGDAATPDVVTLFDTNLEADCRARFPNAAIVSGAGARLVATLAAWGRSEARSRAIQDAAAGAFSLDRTTPGSGQGGKGLSPEAIIGRSPAMREALSLIESVAPMPTPALLLGETGVGKDLAARIIHQLSHLRQKPFVAINCTALPPALMESELFGYRKGAFTGAEENRPGLLEAASGGTLFLDEIGDMPLELQGKLLRFLQTGEVRRVGETGSRTVEARIIAATNKAIDLENGGGSFRRDLYYRLATFTITLPPLRERASDVPYLAYHFLTVAEAKLNKRVGAISDQALDLLSAYAWPGNVRELANVVERAVILCRNDRIEPCDLPTEISRARPERRTDSRPVEAASAADEEPSPLHPDETDGPFVSQRDRVMSAFEKKELLYYLRQADGNKSLASRLSGIPRRTFYRKLEKYGL